MHYPFQVKYLENARTILKRVQVEEETYLDIKPAREAFGTAYLAVVEAINAILIKNGVTRKQLSKSVNGYRAALRKYLEGDDTQVVKDTIKVAEKFIERLGRYALCSTLEMPRSKI